MSRREWTKFARTLTNRSVAIRQRTKPRWPVWPPLILAAGLLSACGGPKAPAPAPGVAGSGTAGNQPDASRWRPGRSPYAPDPTDKPPGPVQAPVWSLAELKPDPGGPGVILFEPVGDVPAELREFADGAQLWLDAGILGRPELGQTPPPALVRETMQQLGHREARLGPADAAAVARHVGVAHPVTSRVSGTPAKARLEFQVLAAKDGAGMGTPIAAEGSLDEITRALPEVARQILERVGITVSNGLPNQVEVGPADLQFYARINDRERKQVTAQDHTRLRELASRSVPAGILLLVKPTAGHSQTMPSDDGEALLRQFPDNMRLYPVLAEFAHGAVRSGTVDPLGEARTRHPRNLQLLLAGLIWEQRTDHLADRRALAEEAVRAAPHSAPVHLLLSNSLQDQAQEIRKGRFMGDLSADERGELARFYAYQVELTGRAIELAPQSAEAWHVHCRTTTVAGKETEAKQALWRSLELDRGPTSGYYYWGLEIFQKKWFDEPASLKKVADMAAAQNYPKSDLGADIGGRLQQLGFEAQAKRLRDRRAAATKKQLAANPDDPTAILARARSLSTGAQADEKLQLYRKYLKLKPNARWVHLESAPQLCRLGRFEEAVRGLELYQNDGPRDSSSTVQLTRLYLRMDRLEDAQRQVDAARGLQPKNLEVLYLAGVVAHRRGKADQARTGFEEAIRVQERTVWARLGLAKVLKTAGRADEARKMAEAARENARLYTELNSADYDSRLALGDAEAFLGNQAEAREHWRAVAAGRRWEPAQCAEERLKGKEADF